MYSLIMVSLMLQKIFKRFNFYDASNHIADIILLYCSPTIYVVAFFTIEGGCNGSCGQGSVHASFTNILSQFDEDEDEDENEDNEERVILYATRLSIWQEIYIQFNSNVGDACCSGWYIPDIYNSREECEEEHFSNGETEYGAVSVYNYADIYSQLQESGELSIELN